MNVEVKKLTRSVYLAAFVIIIALVLAIWFVTHSFISIKVNPTEATFYIDNEESPISNSGLVRKFVSPGTHTIRVEAEGYIGFEQQIDFSRGLSKKMPVYLKEMPEPFVVSQVGSFLEKGNAFNDSFILEGQTFFKVITKIGEDGEIALGEKKAISNPIIPEVDEIIWSPKKDLALLREGGEISLFDLKKYDFVNQTNEPWGRNIGSIAWAPDNSKIAYYNAPPSGEKSLIFSNITNTETNRVLNFKDYDIDNPLLRWSPDSEWLLIIPRNSDVSKNKIYVFNAYSRALNELIDVGNQTDAIFSPDGNKIIYSTHSKDPGGPINSVLSIMERNDPSKELGRNEEPKVAWDRDAYKRSLGLRASLEKISWSNDSEHITVATYDHDSKQESIFMFNTKTISRDGFIIKDLADTFVHKLFVTDDKKMVVYEDNAGIYAINVN